MTSVVSQHSGASLTFSDVTQPRADAADAILNRLLKLEEENKRAADTPVPGGGGVSADAPPPLTGGQRSLPDKTAVWSIYDTFQPPLHVPRPMSLGPMAPPHYAGGLPSPGPAIRPPTLPPTIPLDIADEVMSSRTKRVGRSSDRPSKKPSSRSGSFTSAKSTELAQLEDRVDNLRLINDELQYENGSLGRRLADYSEQMQSMTERIRQQDLVVQNAIQNTTADHQGAMTALGDLQRQVSILTKDNAELKYYLTDAQQQVASASAWNMRYKEEMSDLNKHNEEIKAEATRREEEHLRIMQDANAQYNMIKENVEKNQAIMKTALEDAKEAGPSKDQIVQYVEYVRQCEESLRALQSQYDILHTECVRQREEVTKEKQLRDDGRLSIDKWCRDKVKAELADHVKTI